MLVALTSACVVCVTGCVTLLACRARRMASADVAPGRRCLSCQAVAEPRFSLASESATGDVCAGTEMDIPFFPRGRAGRYAHVEGAEQAIPKTLGRSLPGRRAAPVRL